MGRTKTHGDSGHDYKYKTWSGMKERCHNKNSERYESYGGRGIKVCDEWVNSYIAFRDYILDTLGERPEGHSLDRINNDGNYEPGNLRWASRKQQANNRRMRNNNTSGYVGIHLDKPSNKWQARISVNGNRISLGYYKKLHDAVIARNNYIAGRTIKN